MVTGKNNNDQLMSSSHAFEFHGGNWQKFFHYDDTEDHVGSHITWKGMGIGHDFSEDKEVL